MRNKLSLILIIISSLIGTAGCTSPRQIEQDFSKSTFKYGEVYLPEAIGVYADSLGLNSLDKDWGIWGHNIYKILPDNPSETIYAKVNGSTIKKQYCFTSPRLYEYISEYIEDQYGPKDKARFSIIPNDNDIVCLCVRCVEAGNTPGNSSPAIFSMIRKLATHFPNHIFYTSDYGTTRALPTDSLPQNSGVMVSAMPYPLSYDNTTDENVFLETLDNWKGKTKRILIWDYINNFDDYFTPFPILGIMQSRLQQYKNHNVSAVFLNGSGEDVSSLSRLKSIVLAALIADPDTDWRVLLKQKATEIYPITGETIANFILAQENFIEENKAHLPLYEGVYIALKRYLPQDSYIEFHDTLKNLRDKTSGEERKDIDMLLSELALTRLEINRINGNVQDSDKYLTDLSRLIESGVNSYNESGWLIESYIRDYRYMLDHKKSVGEKNKLSGVKLKALTPLDEDYSDISIITDGLLGIPSNYHNGHLITSPEKETSISVPYFEGSNKLNVWLTYNTGFKIHLPESVTVSAPGMLSVTKSAEYPKDLSGHCLLEFDLPSTVTGPITVTLTKNPENRSMAIEEIELF